MQTIENSTKTRRRFFTASASMLGMAGIAALPQLDAQSTAPPGDLAVLNYALRLENLEAAFYTQGLAKFSASDFASSATASLLGTKVTSSMYGYFQNIQAHETNHVTTLTSVINSLGGTPVAADCYNFGLTTADAFMAAAAGLENTGVMAYDGALAMIQTPALQQAAATIATIEARHASYLNLITAGIPFPSPFDTPQTMAQILAVAGGFITGCSTAPPAGNTTGAVITNKVATYATNTAMLDGSKSTSFDGRPLMYLWEAVLGDPSVTIASPSSPMTTLTFKGGPGVYVFTLQVTDSRGLFFTDTAKYVYTGA